MACSGVMSTSAPAGSVTGSPYATPTGAGPGGTATSNGNKSTSSPNRIQYQMAVMDLGRNSLAMGKILKRQITKYLNECRNRESDSQGIKAALKLKVRKSDPPPVPKVDYTASVADDDSYQDGGWDTDFDDDLEEDDASSLNGEKDGAKRSQTNASNRLQQPDVVTDGPPSCLRDNNQILSRSLSEDLQGQRSRLDQTDNSGPADVPSKKPIPKPPNSLIPLPKVLPRPPSLLPRPKGQPPAPPGAQVPTVSPVILKMILKASLKEKAEEQETIACDETNGNCDNYEIPLVDGGGSKSSSVDLQADSGSGSIDLSARSSTSSPLNCPSISHFTGFDSSPNHSQLELENEFTQEENYEAVDESQWSGSSSGVSVMSSLSDKPALPPKHGSPNANCVPPPLPEKPFRQRLATTPPLPTKEKPLLPRKISDDGSSKSRQRNGCKNVLSSLFTNITSRMTLDRRSESMLGVDKATTPDRETIPIAIEISNLKKSISATSLRHGYGDTLTLVGNRPLPPVPNRSPADRTTKEESQLKQPLNRLQPQSSPLNSPTSESLDSYPWFQRVERENAESILKRLGKSGSYLVRESRRAGQFNPYTLTIFFDEKIFHLNIRHRPDGKFALGKEKDNEKTFASVWDLISFHQREVILLTARGMQIGQTCLVKCPAK